MSLLITIFLLVFVSQIITWIGQTVLLEHAYSLHLWLTRSPLLAKQRALRSQIVENKAELMKTSAQDQFARWAKLRRSVDKGLAELEALNSESASHKSAYAMKFNTVVWLSTTGTQLVVGWRYRKEAVFYLPKGWLGPLTGVLALPFAPKGSVSVGVWQMACRRVMVVLERVVQELAVSSHTKKGPGDVRPGPNEARPS